MKFSNIRISNFRQYYKSIIIDLDTDGNKNIVLIGGENGFGKTNFLSSIVWCLYGEQMSKVDDNFKMKIKKDGNYSSFMQESLNNTSKREGESIFSVEIKVSDIELPELRGINIDGDKNTVIIKRTYNISTNNETLSIKDEVLKVEIFEDESDKNSFINDYIIPLNAAKFVFFDAEKISEIANLSIKEEGSFINDALGNILGLDTYEILIDDFEEVINSLKKDSASLDIKIQIKNREDAVQLAQTEIEDLEGDNAEKQKEIDEAKKSIRDYDNLISQYSKKGNISFDRHSILQDIEKLKIKEIELNERFNELSEIIPLAILTANLEEVNKHIELQDKEELFKISQGENAKKIEKFIERLFNNPPEPENSTLSFKDKVFYYEKAKDLGAELFEEIHDVREINFKHDLNNSDKKIVLDALNLVNIQSKDLFENTIDEFNEIKVKLSELNRTMNKVDADIVDPLVLDYSAKKETAVNTISDTNIEIGKNSEKIKMLRENIIRYNKELISFRNKAEINEKNKIKIGKCHEYIKILNKFLDEQKDKHKVNLENSILNELDKLMHKQNLGNHENKFIENVKVTILASGQGMKVTLLDFYGNEINKENLASGEKQIYISCLIKAILKESINSLPIFIDTPLGRLDEKHRDNMTSKYYPELSEQVVLFSTNTEITPKRYHEISKNISKSYVLVNDGNNTNIKNGYFNSYEN